MTDKVQKIREKVERLKEIAKYNLSYSKMDRVAWMQQLSVCTNLLSFIDFLQGEPVNENLEVVAEEWDESLYRSDAFKAGAKWQKEQLMKDAVEVEYWWIKPIIYSSTEKTFNIGNDDKVKLIIIKED